ncbi:hypothetical protein [Bradyrhizobium sp. WSM2254]|uniref:hypothetical protein n=1 Tax=Bradyrhizobium sp. WSM2254 TaxID=1188263 RepID=UPI0012EC5695|nr:hypothetical protein [Bradyrhizobium sp. WSM2254]
MVELKMTSLDSAELIADETEQHVPVLIAPATANYKSEVAFHSALYAVQNESQKSLKRSWSRRKT